MGLKPALFCNRLHGDRWYTGTPVTGPSTLTKRALLTGGRDIDDIGGFLEWGYPRMDGSTIENPTTMDDDWG